MAGTTEERSGWVLFATTVFIVLGVFNTIYGLALLLNHEWLIVTSDTVWYLDISAWGWITLIIAVVQFLVAWGIANAEMWARILGVIAADGSLLSVVLHHHHGALCIRDLGDHCPRQRGTRGAGGSSAASTRRNRVATK